MERADTLSEDGRVENLAIRLEGDLVVLEPLAEEHAEDLWRAAQAPEIWRWLAHIGSSHEYFDGWLEMSLTAQREGREGVFAIRELASGSLVGSSRYLNVRPPDRVVEIGWTWLNPSAWRTGINVETKLLLLGHAFEDLGCVRVELKTDARNERSRAAVAALPAQFEGVLRKHMTVPDVGVRDSAYYSVIDDEWPEVRANLQRRLSRQAGRERRRP
jgi:N-acetyltransferase